MIKHTLFGVVVAAGLVGSAVFAVLSDFGRRTSFDNKSWPVGELVVRGLGLGLDQVSLVGHRFTSDNDVFGVLELSANTSFLKFDSADALARLQKLPWVETASIERIYPSQLVVHIKERKPFALWRNARGLYLIDVTGRVLSRADEKTESTLPRVEGIGAAVEVGPLMRLIVSSKLVSQRFERAVRVSNRRWTIYLTRGVKIDLPAQGAASALAYLRSQPMLREIIARPDTVLDMRVSGKIVVRSRGDLENPVAVGTPVRSVERGSTG